jgi:hypothetical protein
MTKKMELKTIKVSKLKGNSGQIDGLPGNPRFIKDEKFKKLVKSIEADPEMMELREVIAYDNNGELVVIMGNMRLRACIELGIKEVPCKILPPETPLEKLKAYTIKDNVSYGEHDFDMLKEDWDIDLLVDFGVDFPAEQESATEVDYSILDDEDVSKQLEDMTNGVKKAIQIEFEAEHYEDAYALVKFWREKAAYVGGMIMEYLKAEKEKL